MSSETKTGTFGKSFYSVGRFTYGFENIDAKWTDGASLNIGAFCSIAFNVKIFLGGNHRTDWITTFPFGHVFLSELGGENIVGNPSTKGDVNIGNDVWIGENVTIMSGVTIGDGAVIAANSCVTKNILPYHIGAGNPARSLKSRFDAETIDLLLTLKWWELPLPVIKNITTILSSTPNKDTLRELISEHRK